MLCLKGDLDKKTKGMPKSFVRSLDENILENLVTKLQYELEEYWKLR